MQFEKFKNLIKPIPVDNSPATILLVINSLQGGGAEKFVLTIGDAFTKLGFDVHVLYFKDKLEHELSRDLTYHLVEYDSYRWLPKGEVRNKIFAKRIDWYVTKTLKNPVLVMSNLERSDNVMRYSNLSNIVHIIHSTLSLYYDFAKTQDIDLLVQDLKNVYSAHPCVCVSRGVQDDFIKYLGNVTPLTTIYNPVDRHKVLILSNEFIPEYSKYIVNVGSFKKAKRHDVLLKAYARTTKALPLILLGQGNLEDDVRKLSQELNIADSVIFKGFCRNPYPYIKHAQFKVLSSDREGCPMVIPEASSLDVPVISTNCQSGPSELLPKKNLVPVNNIDALAKKMDEAMQDATPFKSDFNESLLPVNIAKKYLEFMKVKLPL